MAATLSLNPDWRQPDWAGLACRNAGCGGAEGLSKLAASTR